MVTQRHWFHTEQSFPLNISSLGNVKQKELQVWAMLLSFPCRLPSFLKSQVRLMMLTSQNLYEADSMWELNYYINRNKTIDQKEKNSGLSPPREKREMYVNNDEIISWVFFLLIFHLPSDLAEELWCQLVSVVLRVCRTPEHTSLFLSKLGGENVLDILKIFNINSRDWCMFSNIFS